MECNKCGKQMDNAHRWVRDLSLPLHIQEQPCGLIPICKECDLGQVLSACGLRPPKES